MAKYCYRCGHKTIKKPNGCFNDKTGEPLMFDRCPNLKCEVGCGENGGHDWSFWGMRCKKCGKYCS